MTPRGDAGIRADVPRVLVLRALGLGDLLVALPAIRGVQGLRPDHRVVLATSAGVASLARRALPGVAVVAVGELSGLPVRGPFDLAVNLHGRGPQSTRLLLAVRPAALLAFDTDTGPAWPTGVHEVERWCSLVDRLQPDDRAAVDRSALEVDRAVLGDVDCDRPPGPFTLVHPGAGQASRRWPLARWARVAAAERRAGRAVVVTGSSTESARCAAVADRAGLGPGSNRAGTTVLELARLVAEADRVVCGDTGVGHLATALARPSVLLFGPSSPAAWGPPPDRPRHRVLWAGRTGDPRADRVDPGLLEIAVGDVVAALADLESLDPEAAELEPGLVGAGRLDRRSRG